MSIHESSDAVIRKIIETGRDFITAEVSARLSQEQSPLFRDLHGNILWTARNTLAVDGTNVKRIGDIVKESNDLVTTVKIHSFAHEFMPSGFELADFEQDFLAPVPCGKFYLRNPEDSVSESEAREYLKSRQLILGSQYSLTGNRMIIDLGNHKVLPNGNYNAEIKREIIRKAISRHRVWALHKFHPAEILQIPEHGGLITFVKMSAYGLELVVNHSEHSDAIVGSQHTNSRFYFEFIGNGRDTPISSVELELYRPVNKKTRIFNPIDISSLGSGTKNVPSSLETICEKFKNGEINGFDIQYVNFTERPFDVLTVSRYDVNAQKRFYDELSTKENLILYFNRSPFKIDSTSQGDLSDRLKSLSKEGKLKELWFHSKDQYFSHDSIRQINELWENGTAVYWYNRLMDRWMAFYSELWVKPEKLQEFTDYYLSGRIISFYGSSKKISKESSQDTDDTIGGLAKFFNGKMAIITGGNGEDGSFMHYVTNKARDLESMSGAVFWEIPGQSPYGNLDFVQYFKSEDLSPRGELLHRISGVEIYARDFGWGTLMEASESRVKTRVEIGALRLRIYLGDSWKKVGETIGENNMNIVARGKDVYNLINTHYR